MDAKTIDEMTDDELAAEVAAQGEMLFKYRFQVATGQIQNPARLRVVRRQIARLKTAQRARQLKARTTA
jgi:large subunit ribosomal protein L29